MTLNKEQSCIKKSYEYGCNVIASLMFKIYLNGRYDNDFICRRRKMSRLNIANAETQDFRQIKIAKKCIVHLSIDLCIEILDNICCVWP